MEKHKKTKEEFKKEINYSYFYYINLYFLILKIDLNIILIILIYTSKYDNFGNS